MYIQMEVSLEILIKQYYFIIANLFNFKLSHKPVTEYWYVCSQHSGILSYIYVLNRCTDVETYLITCTYVDIICFCKRKDKKKSPE